MIKDKGGKEERSPFMLLLLWGKVGQDRTSKRRRRETGEQPSVEKRNMKTNARLDLLVFPSPSPCSEVNSFPTKCVSSSLHQTSLSFNTVASCYSFSALSSPSSPRTSSNLILFPSSFLT